MSLAMSNVRSTVINVASRFTGVPPEDLHDESDLSSCFFALAQELDAIFRVAAHPNNSGNYESYMLISVVQYYENLLE